jgi:apolipoprotein N-acyltransferase
MVLTTCTPSATQEAKSLDFADGFVPLSRSKTFMAGAVAVLGYGIGFAFPAGAPGVLFALPAICLLSRQQSAKRAFWIGLSVAFGMYAPSLAFFTTIFGPSAILLWTILSVPVGVFLLLLNVAHRRLGPIAALLLTPVFWTGLEYFRSEVWYLRFAWLLPGQAAALLPGVRWNTLGVYGLGFIYMATAALSVGPRPRLRLAGAMGLVVLAVLMYLPDHTPIADDSALHVAGIQAEEWKPRDVAEALDRLATAHPEAQLLVLSECAFFGRVPPEVRDVVRKHQRYLIAGGRKYLSQNIYENTAFVVGPDGNDIFSQVKSVPVQFMSDGLPATERRVWDSPWGKIGIAICYDACYANVMDDFVRQGACGLIVPTMDAMSWGEFERRMLHGRVAPVRSAEYGIPTFGVWSSGVSQLVDRSGGLVATAGYPGQGEMIAGSFDLGRTGHLPPDRPLALATLAGTGLFIGYLVVERIWRRPTHPHHLQRPQR